MSATADALNEQITKLLAAAQKGIHAETHLAEMRRCMMRTITLLDDFVALKRTFEIRPAYCPKTRTESKTRK